MRQACEFLLGADTAFKLRDAESACQRRNASPAVAAENLYPGAGGAQAVDRCRSVLAQRFAQFETCQRPLVVGEDDEVTVGGIGSVRELWPADPVVPPIDVALDATAVNPVQVPRAYRYGSRRLREASVAIWMGAAGFELRGDFRHCSSDSRPVTSHDASSTFRSLKVPVLSNTK